MRREDGCGWGGKRKPTANRDIDTLSKDEKMHGQRGASTMCFSGFMVGVFGGDDSCSDTWHANTSQRDRTLNLAPRSVDESTLPGAISQTPGGR